MAALSSISRVLLARNKTMIDNCVFVEATSHEGTKYDAVKGPRPVEATYDHAVLGSAPPTSGRRNKGKKKEERAITARAT